MAPDSDAPRERRPGQSTRRKARKRALDILFEADLRGEKPLEALARRAEYTEDGQAPEREYTVLLVEGVAQHWDELGDLLRTYAEGWEPERMPALDRNLLRIALFELLHRDDIPDAVAIDEAVALAAELSTDDSPRFINGLLGRVQLLKGV